MVRCIYQSGCGPNYAKMRVIIVAGSLRQLQFPKNRAHHYPTANAIDRYSNNLFDGPFSKEDEKGKMVVIRREDDHRTSHDERDEFVGVRQTPGATTYYPLGGHNSPLKRLYSDNPTFPFLRLICPQRRHFNTHSRRITRHKYGPDIRGK